MNDNIVITIIILTYLLILIISSTRYVSVKQARNILLIFAFLVAIFAFTFTPKPFIRWDLLEHYKIIDKLRISNDFNVFQQYPFPGLILINTYMYLISLLPNNHLFQTIPVFLDFFIFSYIIIDIYKREISDQNSIKIRHILICLFVFCATIGLKLAISGVRCVLAVSLCSLAIYWEYICQEKRFASILLYLCALLIHNFSIVIVILRILLLIPRIIKVIPLIALTLVLLGTKLSKLLLNYVNNSYLHDTISRAIQTQDRYAIAYVFRNYEFGTKLIYLSFIFVLLWIIYIIFKTARKSNNPSQCYITEKQMRIDNWMKIVSYTGIGMALNYLYMERWMYVLAFALAMFFPYYLLVRRERLQLIPLFGALTFALFFNDLYIFMVNNSGTYFLAFR